MEYLLDDVLFNILVFLPVLSLLRCRLVSTNWRTIIDSDSFIKQHLDKGMENHRQNLLVRSNHNMYFMNGGKNEPMIFSRLDFPVTSFENVRLTNSCNGLVCMRCVCSEDFVVICNPSLRQSWRLPKAEEARIPGLHGIGYDSEIDAYKVISISKYAAKIYTLQANSKWRTLDATVNDIICEYIQPVFLNDSLYWLASDESHLPPTSIISFNFVDEKFGTVPVPAGREFIFSFGILGGSLYMLMKTNDGQMEAWMMTEYGVDSPWAKQFTIPDPNVLYSDVLHSVLLLDTIFVILKPLYYYNTGGIDLDCERRDIIIYDFIRKRPLELTLSDYRVSYQTVTYVPSLVSLGSAQLEEGIPIWKKRRR